MLADDSIDAVEILTPTHLHHDHVIEVLKAGKHVSVQKPVANSADDARAVQAAAEAAGRTLRISECFVHYPPLELAKKLVAEGAIGNPSSLRIRTLVGQTDSQFQANLRPEGYGWRLDKRRPGGHLFDDMVNQYAMALWLLDLDITSVQGGGAPARLLLRALRRHFRIREPRCARNDGGAVRAQLLHAIQLTTARTSSSRSPATRGRSG
jgi:predicted dehydrogenase